jgi:hypothetical protein
MLKDKAMALGAKFAQFQEVETVLEYATGYAVEYHAAKSVAGLMNRSHWGRIELGGADRIAFLQRMTTNDCSKLVAGHGLQTVLTTPEAKIVELLTVYAKADSLLCITHPQNTRKVFDWFKRNIFFRDKVKPVNITEWMVQLSVFGPRAHEVIGIFAQQTAPPLPSFYSQTVRVFDVDVLIARVPCVAGGGYDIIAPSEHEESIWDALVAIGSPLGLLPMGALAFNALRVEASQPLYGYELTEEHNPLEARLNEAISFSKGCYTGQEVIARLDAYQKLKQALVGVRLLALPRRTLPLPLKIDGLEVGQLTSAVCLPATDVALGLGYVRMKMNEAGRVVEIQDGDETVRGELVSLPFNPSIWSLHE